MFVVAGVTGHVGSVVATTLLAHGAKIKVIVRDAAKGTTWSQKGAEVAVGALDDVPFLTKTLQGAAGFFALLPPNYGATPYLASLRKTADAIVAAIRESRVPHVVMLSSVGADLESGTGPIAGVHHLEKQLRTTAATLSIIRAGSFQENVANALGPAKSAGLYFNMSPSADYAFPQIATQDIGTLAAHELLIPPAKSEVIDLQGPAYSPRQVSEKLGAALGKTLTVVDVPPGGQVEALRKSGMSQELAELMAEMYAGFGSGKVKPSGDRLKLGQTTIDTVIKKLI